MEPYELLLREYGTKSPVELHIGLKVLSKSPQTCADVSAAPELDYPIR